MPFGIVACAFSDNLSRNSCILASAETDSDINVTLECEIGLKDKPIITVFWSKSGNQNVDRQFLKKKYIVCMK